MTEQEILSQPTPHGLPILNVYRTGLLPEGSQAQCDAFMSKGFFDRSIHNPITFDLVGVSRTIRE